MAPCLFLKGSYFWRSCLIWSIAYSSPVLPLEKLPLERCLFRPLAAGILPLEKKAAGILPLEKNSILGALPIPALCCLDLTFGEEFPPWSVAYSLSCWDLTFGEVALAAGILPSLPLWILHLSCLDLGLLSGATRLSSRRLGGAWKPTLFSSEHDFKLDLNPPPQKKKTNFRDTKSLLEVQAFLFLTCRFHFSLFLNFAKVFFFSG